MVKQRRRRVYRLGITWWASSTLLAVVLLFGGVGKLRRSICAAHGRTGAGTDNGAYAGIFDDDYSERPFGRISITNPEIVDLVLRTDKSAVLIPQHLGRTNVDFLDDKGSLIGSMDIVVVRQSAADRVVVYDHPTLEAHSSYHCGPSGCERVEEMPAKEQALTPPGMTEDQARPVTPGYQACLRDKPAVCGVARMS